MSGISTVVCPQCGFELETGLAKLMCCPSCRSSVLIENKSNKQSKLCDLNVVTNAGRYLFEVGKAVQLMGREYIPQGYSVYEYEERSRIEWELLDQENHVYFLNQEDENLFLVKPISSIKQTLPSWSSLQPNTHLSVEGRDWLVVEKNRLRFVAYHGALLTVPVNDTSLECTYFSNTQGECLVLVFNAQESSFSTGLDIGSEKPIHKAFQGWWLDPMDISFS